MNSNGFSASTFIFRALFELKRHIDGEVRASTEATHSLDYLTVRTQQLTTAARVEAVEVGAAFRGVRNVLERPKTLENASCRVDFEWISK